MYISRDDARIRNLKMKLTHWVIEKGGDLDIKFTEDILKREVFFKEKDIEISSSLFDDNGYLKDGVKRDIRTFIDKYQINKDEDEMQLETLYSKLKNYFNNNTGKHEYESNLQKTIEIINRLHWKYLPIYQEQYICNNGYMPEEIQNYYNHFHAIEDLYWHIFTDKKIDWKSMDGDINLNIDFDLKIYTTRWGHYDHYKMRRTTEGWQIKGLPAGTGSCKKNGEGAFTNLLEHDLVCYPKEGVLYALEELWKDADTTNMSVKDLQDKIQDLSEWIKQVEIVTHKYQPEWCGYY